MQDACIPKQTVGPSYICKVGIMDNKNETFLLPFPPSLSLLHCFSLDAAELVPRKTAWNDVLDCSAS